DAEDDPAGLAPHEELSAIRRRSRAFLESLYRVVNDMLLPAMAASGISLVAVRDLDDARRAALATFFREAVLPVLTPLAIDVSRPFPLLSSLSLNLALLLEPAPGEEPRRLAIVQVPAVLTRLVEVAGGDGYTFVRLEDVI